MCLRNISESVKLLSAGRSYGINIFRSMPQRLNFYQTNSEAIQPMLMLEKYLRSCGLEKPLLELVKLRSSQINGCAYCIDMHTKDARAAGETEQRLYLLNA
jgi:AhpD family alkylhydroperoxidase